MIALVNRGNAHLQAGEPAKATADLERFLEAAPRHSSAAWARRLLTKAKRAQRKALGKD